MPSIPELSHGMRRWPCRCSGSNAQGMLTMVGMAGPERFERSSSPPVRQAVPSPSRQLV